jgi:hypothetical protein
MRALVLYRKSYGFTIEYFSTGEFEEIMQRYSDFVESEDDDEDESQR